MSGLSKVGIVGARNMSAGIAQKGAQAGLKVVMGDVSKEISKRGFLNIQNTLYKAIERKIFADEHFKKNAVPY